MHKSIRLFAATAALVAFTSAGSANMQDNNQSKIIDAKASAAGHEMSVICDQKEVRDASGNIVIAGCAGIAMPCVSDSDCCSNNCDNSACNE